MNFDGGRVKTVCVASLQVSFIATSDVRSSKVVICVKVLLFLIKNLLIFWKYQH